MANCDYTLRLWQTVITHSGRSGYGKTYGLSQLSEMHPRQMKTVEIRKIDWKVTFCVEYSSLDELLCVFRDDV